MGSLNEISPPSSTSSTTCSAPSSSPLPGRAGPRGTERREEAKDLRSKAPPLVSFTVHQQHSPPSQFAFQRAKMQVPGKWQRVSSS